MPAANIPPFNESRLSQKLDALLTQLSRVNFPKDSSKHWGYNAYV
ncbi:MAG: hypothetical protein Q8R79_07310 [Legionellaceae bacterium]|nr:hypothetical protein [Legionellaceae bacterium]